MADSLNTPTLPKLHPGLSRRKLMREMAAAGAVVTVSTAPAVAAVKPKMTDEERESVVRPLSMLGHALADGRVDINWTQSVDEQTVFTIRLERLEGAEFMGNILAGTVFAERCTLEYIKAAMERKS